MKRKQVAALLLMLAMLLTLGACGKTAEQPKEAAAGAVAATVPGYCPSYVAMPDWLGQDWFNNAFSSDGDWLWLFARDTQGTPVIAGYDTLHDRWQRLDFDLNGARHVDNSEISCAENSLWVLLHEGVTYEQALRGDWPEDLGYYVLRIDRRDGSSSCVRVPFDGSRGTETSSLIFEGLIALDDERALLLGPEEDFVIDSDVNILHRGELMETHSSTGFAVDGTRYYWTSEGYAPLDPATLQLGPPLPDRGLGGCSSNAGHYLVSLDRSLFILDPGSGETRLLFPWMDVAMSYADMGGWGCAENSQGVFFYLGESGLIRVEPGEVPVREPLVLGCFGNSSDEMFSYSTVSYYCTMELLDAVIRFNNTDPAYKIEIQPLIYGSESELTRLLVELATGSRVDLLDTSMLPESAVDDGLFVDMLPYLDADETVGREDFIEPLLNVMLHEGGLYEYTDRFTLLTMLTHSDLFPGRENWTAEGIQALIAAHPDIQPLWHSVDRDLQLTLFAWAATAEFIDWDAMTCSFDDPAFIHWLELLKSLPSDGAYSEEPRLLDICYDYAGDAGFSARYPLKADYAVAGFPETEGTGSYFLKLGSSPSEWRSTLGDNTRLGILASGQHHEAAWRFMRTLMLGPDKASLKSGIPVLRSRFEKALDASVTNRHNERFDIDEFNEADAARLREQVYGTTKLVHTDEELLQVIRGEAKAFFAGQKSAEEAAWQIQSRLSLYLAEKA